MHVCLFVKRAFAYDVIISTYGFVYAETMGKPRMLYIRNFLRSLTPADEMNACLKNSNL